MCEIKQETSLTEEIWKAMSALMGDDAVIPGAEKEFYMPDKYINAKHAYEHLRAAYKKACAL